MKPIIIIPAYNEAENIVTTVKTLQAECPLTDYIIVNDGSKDNTATVCKEAGLNILDSPINLGLPGAFQLGMQYASKNGYDAALQFDGDGQHLPEYISALCTAMEDSGADIIIGSRFLEEKKPLSSRMLGSSLIRFLIRLATGVKLTDPTSGMRLFSKRLIEKFAWSLNYDPEPDTLVYLIRCGAKVVEVPVKMKEREFGESYLSATRAAVYMLRICVSILFIQWFRKKGVLG